MKVPMRGFARDVRHRRHRAVTFTMLKCMLLGEFQIAMAEFPSQGRRIRHMNWSLDARIRRSALSLKRYIPMLLWRILVALALQHLQRIDQLFARLARHD